MRFIKAAKVIMLIGALSPLLAACQPTQPPAESEPLMYGIPKSQWLRLTSEQQEAIMQGYGGTQFYSAPSSGESLSGPSSGPYIWPKKQSNDRSTAPPPQPIWHDD